MKSKKKKEIENIRDSNWYQGYRAAFVDLKVRIAMARLVIHSLTDEEVIQEMADLWKEKKNEYEKQTR